ncbi:FG-GAP repeat domain-containing protein [Streptomyces sp. NPDC015232]|uniref:FG-GAP repeat domain-containing protein n=1 Tax=unclassified Streptomyces TaxID=2593676 RepID=UPI0036F6E5A1
MSHARPARRRLAAAVVTVLAVTVGATALTAPAIAATAVEGTTAADATTNEVAPFPKKSTVFGAGTTGYLALTQTAPYGEEAYSLTRYWVTADGSAPPRELNWGTPIESTGSGDIVATHGGGQAALVDMATDKTLRTVQLGGDVTYAGAAGKALFTTMPNAYGDRILHLNAVGTASGKMTVGLPGDATNVHVEPGTADHALLTYTTGSDAAKTFVAATIDLATNTVTETYQASAQGDMALSPTHLAWVEYDADGVATVVTVDRATKATRKTVVGKAWRRDVEVGLVGDWVTYGTRSGLTDLEKDPLYALTARSLKDGTTTRKLLDHTLSATVAPDGAQIVRGGTVAQGEGLYRIVQGADGLPTATLVASSGESTKVALLGSKVPAVVDLDQNKGVARLEWTLSRYNVHARITLRHNATKKVFTQTFTQPENGVVRLDWEGLLNDGRFESAYNGDYTWEVNAEPMNGIGPNLVTSGTFKVVRKAAPHDFNDNGSPDVLMRDSKGGLWRVDTFYDRWNHQLASGEQKLVGTGWNGYNQIEAAGNIGGAAHADLIARDTSGVLWHFLGKGDGTFAGRYKIASGMGGYNKFAAGSDLNGDGRADLVATDTAGVMWLYKGTGSWSAPYSPRVKIGTGWNGYNQITATGNIAGGTAGDLVARDKDGVLWLYLGKGDGTFAPRVRIGAGWGGYSHLVGIGDADRDGRPDLYAANSGNTGSYLYKGTGSWSAPFGAREYTGLPNNWPTSLA